MGACMLRNQLGREGAKAARLHIGTPLQGRGIAALAAKPITRKSQSGHKNYRLLLRKVVNNGSNRERALYTTNYMPMVRGFAT